MELGKNRYAVVIGTGHYEDPDTHDIPFACTDAKKFAELLRSRRVGQFPELNVTLIVDGDSTLVRRKLEEAFAGAARDDLVVVYFSCHGIRDADGELYLLTQDSLPRLYPQTSTIPISLIKTLMKKARSQRQVLILDCCFGGSFGEGILKGNDNQVSLDELSGKGRYVMAASSSIQPARPHQEGEFSLFTHFLLEGLETGEADRNQDSLISVEELFSYVEPRVVEVSDRTQEPVSWGLETSGEIYIATSRYCRNRLERLFKLDPALATAHLKKWNVDQFEVREGTPPTGNLITRPILTQAELQKCYLPSPVTRRLVDKVTGSKDGRVWLLISPEGTGKTSLLTHLSASFAESKPAWKILKISRLPPNPSFEELSAVLDWHTDGHGERSIAIFDGNVLEPGCAQLLLQVAKSESQLSAWATCSQLQYPRLIDREPGLKEHVVAENVPGYIDTDAEFFRSFVSTKFGDLLSSDSREKLLQRTNVTVSDLCTLYVTLKDAPIAVDVVSQKSIGDQIRAKFYSMPRQAQFLARIVAYFGSLPREVVQLVASQSDLFREQDYVRLQDEGFVFVEEAGPLSLSPAAVKLAAQMRQIGDVRLAPYEQELVINTLLSVAEEEEGLVEVAVFLSALGAAAEGLNEVQSRRYRQLIRKAEGGQLCSVCEVYYPADLEWCPTCGTELPTTSEAAAANSARGNERTLHSVPFPDPRFSEDVDRPQFDWAELDLSAFN